jgi:hypothetical protein
VSATRPTLAARGKLSLASRLRGGAAAKRHAAELARAAGDAILGTEPLARDKRRACMLAYQDLVMEERRLLDMAREVEEYAELSARRAAP